MAVSVTVGISLRNAFGESILQLADEGISFMCGDCDVQGGTGLSILARKYPERVIQFGICEQAGIATGAGMALATGEPFIMPLFAAFAARAWEIFRLSVAYNQANLKLVMSHVGPCDVGADGVSAGSGEHYAIWRVLGIPVIHPASPLEMSQAVRFVLTTPGPMVLLTGRSPVRECLPRDYRFEFGKIQPVAGNGRDCFIFAAGNEVSQAVETVEMLGKGYGVEATAYNVSTISPMDRDTLAKLAGQCSTWVVVEDHSVLGGLFGAISEVAVQLPRPPRIVPVGMPGWGQSGSPDELRAFYGLDSAGIARKVLRVIS